MAIALTPFEALCGFRPLEEISKHMDTYPEFVELIGEQTATEFKTTVGDNENSNKAALKKVFSALMNSSQERVTKHLAALVSRLQNSTDKSVIDELVVRLDSQYPGGDVGVFSVLLMNYVVLEPGQAMFLGANEPHAYLSGGKCFKEFLDTCILGVSDYCGLRIRLRGVYGSQRQCRESWSYSQVQGCQSSRGNVDLPLRIS